MKNAVHATQARATKMAAGLLTQLSEALARGNSEALTSYLNVMAKFHRYSYYNSMLILGQRPSATHVAGFARWKQLGRWVQSGERGICIIAPSVGRSKAEGEQLDSDDSRMIRYFVAVHVFDVSQTDGDAIPEIGAASGDVGLHLDRLKGLVAEQGIGLAYTSNLDGARGVSHGGDITLLNSLTPAEELQVLAHELAHELLHRGPRRTETTRQIRELEAEAVAYVVTTACGLENATASWDYIRLYAGDEKLLAQSLAHIQRAAADILDYILTDTVLLVA
jgi:antirestriction protein ArdC